MKSVAEGTQFLEIKSGYTLGEDDGRGHQERTRGMEERLVGMRRLKTGQRMMAGTRMDSSRAAH
jgi:hypothetical protein